MLGRPEYTQYCAANRNTEIQIFIKKKVIQKKTKNFEKCEFRKNKSFAELC